MEERQKNWFEGSNMEGEHSLSGFQDGKRGAEKFSSELCRMDKEPLEAH